jgi:fumarate reductase iron-sulfur subunit
MQDINSVPLIVRREIEALLAAPIIKAFIDRFGREAALQVTQEVISTLARQSGEGLKVISGGNSMDHLQKLWPVFGQGGTLEFELLPSTRTTSGLNVTRCRYAEMYRKHGLQEFGFLLSCGRDFAMMEGFNPKIKFARTQTIMEGAPFCDFRFTLEEE